MGFQAAGIELGDGVGGISTSSSGAAKPHTLCSC